MNLDKAKEMVKLIYKAMDDKKAEKITILDIGEISTLADYFVICNATNSSQLEAITDNVCDILGRSGFEGRKTEGAHSKEWILMDYTDVVIHIFSREARAFYDLERIWRDGKNIKIEDI